MSTRARVLLALLALVCAAVAGTFANYAMNYTNETGSAWLAAFFAFATICLAFVAAVPPRSGHTIVTHDRPKKPKRHDAAPRSSYGDPHANLGERGRQL